MTVCEAFKYVYSEKCATAMLGRRAVAKEVLGNDCMA